MIGGTLYNWQRLFDRRNRPAWAVLLLYFSLALIAWYSLYMRTMDSARQEFELHVHDIVYSIEERLRQHEQILLGGEGLLVAGKSVDRAEWHNYIERLHLDKNYPGIQGVGFIQIIRPADLQAHIAAIRAEGFPDYTVRPLGERSLYAPVIYLEPFSGRNLAAFGYNMMSETTRAEAMRMAAESGKTTISGKVKLLQETHGKEQAGFLMYLPVYRKHQAPAAPEEGWKTLQGFVFSPYRIDDLMAGILGDRVLMLDFVIYDGGEETDGARMFDSAGEQAAKAHTAPPAMSALRTIQAYGHTWTVRLRSRPKFEAGFQSPLNAVILSLGGGISLLLFILVLFLISRRERAEELAVRMTRDIRANEEKLRQSEMHIHAILDGADHLIISTNTEGIIQLFNRAAERYLGYRAEEVIGKFTPKLFHDSDEILRRAQELTAAGMPVEPGFEVFTVRARENAGGDTHEWTYIRKDGSRFPVSLTVTALRDGHGEISAFLGIATNITERNLAAQMKRDEAARMGTILDNVVDGIITINEIGNIESFNKAAQKIFGYSEIEVIGNNVKMLMPEPQYSQHDDYLHNYASTGLKKIIGIGQQVDAVRKNGSVFMMDLAVSEIQMGGKRMFTGIVRDITERKKIEHMKSEFISTVSHELRTPLTSIRGALALIAGGVVGELPAAVKPLVDIAHKNSERLILLVNDILDMEKIEAGKMEFDMQPVKLVPLLQQALDGNHAYAEQYKVSYKLASDLSGNLSGAMVNLDANRMMQVLANLLSNAVKYSPAGGKVLVAVERMGQRIRVAVKDNGPGISDEFKDQIFQKFAQADSSDTRKKGGTGLGLSIAKAIVEKMGGSIGFDSQPNVQTTFYVEFPEWSQKNLPEVGHHVDGIAHRVLVCEDNRDTATVLRMMLEQAGYAVDIAYDASQAKQLLAQGGYAAMTLDLALPGQSGISLIRELHGHEATANLPILVVSANAAEGRHELNGEELGVVEWIDKPAIQERLLTVLKGVVGRSGRTRLKVLHVEDDPDVFQVMRQVASEVADTVQAANLAEARQMLAQCRYDLVILDLDLPDGSGKELLPLLKGALLPIPVLVFSVYEIGLEDAKEVDAALVKSRTDNAQLLATIKRLIGVE